VLRRRGVPDSETSRESFWTLIEQYSADRFFVGGAPLREKPRYCVEVSVVQGGLDDDAKLGLVVDFTDAILRAARYGEHNLIFTP